MQPVSTAPDWLNKRLDIMRCESHVQECAIGSVREQEITKIPVIHLRHCERSAAIHGCALRAMDRHDLRPRDDEGILVIYTSLSI